MGRVILVLVFFGFLIATGCGGKSGTKDSSKARHSNQPQIVIKKKYVDPPARTRLSERPRKSEQGSLRSSDSGRGRFDQGPSVAGLGERDAVRRVLKTLEDSLEFAPTLVIWVVDVSPSAMDWHDGILQLVADSYRNRAADSENPPRLLTSLVTVGERPQFVIDEPTGDGGKVAEQLDQLDQLAKDGSGREVTFEAIDAALEKYLDYRTRQRREVLVVVITDEAGDDAERAMELIATPRKYAIPIYVIGVPAPFGRLAGLPQSVEGGEELEDAGRKTAESWIAVRQGPETQAPERIHLQFSGRVSNDLELLDSGFGPYALEGLCRETNGQFIAIRPEGRFSTRGDWPDPSSPRFDPQVMRRYRPRWQSAAEYQQFLESNRAAMALHRAAQMRMVPVMTNPRLDFVQQDQARMKQMLDEAQRAPAKVAEEIDRLYDVLWEGAGDREKLTDLRWQLSYDLAMGRIAAAKARVDGYNDMLAALKRGKSFANERSNVWVLLPDESIETSSSIRSLIERATGFLQGIVEQHPGTPWALIAERELEQKMGWRWEEQ